MSERSYSVSSFTDGGSSFMIRSFTRFTPSVTSIVLVPGWRWIPSTMARWLSSLSKNQEAVLSSSTLSIMLPSSSRRTGDALRYATTSDLYCAALVNCPVACSVKDRCGPVIWPVGRFTFQPFSAVSTSLIPICRAAIACGSICTCTAYFCAPSTCTWATPLTMEIRCAMRVSAYSSSVHSGTCLEVSARYRMG